MVGYKIGVGYQETRGVRHPGNMGTRTVDESRLGPRIRKIVGSDVEFPPEVGTVH